MNEISSVSRRQDLAFALFFGAILILFFYNLFVWYSVRERYYAYYLVYLLYILFSIPHVNGHPLITSQFMYYESPIWGAIGYIFPALFAIEYLQIKRFSKRFFYWIIALTFLLGFFFPLLSLVDAISLVNNITFASLVSLTYNVSLLVVGVYILFKGFKNARFYVLGWSFVLGAMVFYFLTLLSVIPINPFTENITYLCFSAEAILFALALGDRINTLKNENEVINADNLKLVKDHAEVLQEMVRERTLALERAKDEITNQNEEIRLINEDLEKRISDSTKILIEKNRKLKKYAYMNAHDVRGPLARILGLASLIEMKVTPEDLSDYLVKIKFSAQELDKIIHDMNNILKEQTLLDKANGDEEKG